MITCVTIVTVISGNGREGRLRYAAAMNLAVTYMYMCRHVHVHACIMCRHVHVHVCNC